MGISYELIAFIILSICLLGASLMVVSIKNLVNSVLWLILVFVSLAGIFIILSADFLAAVQVLVYAGGVCIMVVFGVMLVQRHDMRESNVANRRYKFAWPVVTGIFILISVLAGRATWTAPTTQVPENTIQELAPILLTNYVIPFEAVAILLTVALTGALLIVKEAKSNDKS